MAGAAAGSSLFLKRCRASWGGEDRVCIRDEVAGSSFPPAPAPTENRVVGELGMAGTAARSRITTKRIPFSDRFGVQTKQPMDTHYSDCGNVSDRSGKHSSPHLPL